MTKDHQTPPRKRSSPRLWLALAAAVLLLYALQRLGCGPVRTEEAVEWIDR